MGSGIDCCRKLRLEDEKQSDKEGVDDMGQAMNAVVQRQSQLGGFWRTGKWRIALKPGPASAALLACAGYYLGAKLGFALTLQPQPVSTLWPPNSILLAALLLTPVRTWWFILLAALPAHWAAQWQSKVPPMMMACWFISNTFEAVLGAGCIRYLTGGPLRFDSFRQVGIFILCGVFFAPFVSSFVDAGFVVLNAFGGSTYWEVWRTRFFSNALAALTLVTVIVSWCRSGIGSLRNVSRAVLAEAAIVTAGLLWIGYLVFVLPAAGPEREPVFLYAPLPFLLWAAVRFGFKGVSASILAFALLAIWGTAHGRGPFASRSPLENALSLQVFLIVVSVPLLCLAAVLQERRRAEKALRSSEERYREVVETQTELICRFLPDTTLTFVNEACCRFFHHHRDELLGQKFVELISETDRVKVFDQLSLLAMGTRASALEFEVRGGAGKLVWHEWVIHAIGGPDGTVAEFQAIGRDISDRKRVEKANEQLAHVSRLAMVGELTASIAHEINQPLGAILSNADAAGMLLESLPGSLDDVKQILADIRKDDVRASKVIQHIRALLHKRQLEMQALDLDEVASETLRFVHAEARQRGVTLESDFAPGLPLVQGDRIHVQQVLLNLILNGMDAMVETPARRRRVAVSGRAHELGGVEVKVRDAGCGIPPEQLPRLFESYFTTKAEGMGLGLSISRAIIEAHRGRIWAENNEAGGMTFHFVLPPAAEKGRLR